MWQRARLRVSVVCWSLPSDEGGGPKKVHFLNLVRSWRGSFIAPPHSVREKLTHWASLESCHCRCSPGEKTRTRRVPIASYPTTGQRVLVRHKQRWLTDQESFQPILIVPLSCKLVFNSVHAALSPCELKFSSQRGGSNEDLTVEKK